MKWLSDRQAENPTGTTEQETHSVGLFSCFLSPHKSVCSRPPVPQNVVSGAASSPNKKLVTHQPQPAQPACVIRTEDTRSWQTEGNLNEIAQIHVTVEFSCLTLVRPRVSPTKWTGW